MKTIQCLLLVEALLEILDPRIFGCDLILEVLDAIPVGFVQLAP